MWALLGVGIPSRIIWAGFLILISWLASPCKAQVATTFIVSSDTGSFKKKKTVSSDKARNLNSIVTDINHMEKKKKKRKTGTMCVEKEKAAAAKASGRYIASLDPFEITALV